MKAVDFERGMRMTALSEIAATIDFTSRSKSPALLAFCEISIARFLAIADQTRDPDIFSEKEMARKNAASVKRLKKTLAAAERAETPVRPETAEPLGEKST